ncbi:replication protein A DNA-binding subunit [Blumeria hordei DH14]|uniref:Replication protein A subunit n=1 Tax=Blumeria graminis f. sp. hordei (strain DH14) TaxID=546991 RepID=N1JHK7_BLUG1|nr:replication protein A DNA-binding subunit [Blumeria hordei DH14]
MEQENNKQENIIRPHIITLDVGDNDKSIQELHGQNTTGLEEPFHEDSSHLPLTASTSSTCYSNFYTVEELTKIGTTQEDDKQIGSKDHPVSESNQRLTSQDLESWKKDTSNSSPATASSSLFRSHVYTIEELLRLRVPGEEYINSELTKNLENLVYRGSADQLIEAPEIDPSLSLCNTPSTAIHELILYPISDLTPKVYNWKIKARVTKKMESQNWNTSKSRGKCFSVYLLDESGEIKATGYNDQCDQFYDSFQEGAVYHIYSPCKIQLAKKQYSTLPNDYELFFDRDTIVEIAEDQEAVPQIRYEFTSISDLQYVELDSLVDVIGILKDIPDCTQTTVRKTGRPCDKRELSIYDESNETIRLTIWGSTALSFSAKPDSIVAFKRCKVGEYGGRSLSLLSSGSLKVDPDIPEAHKLKSWLTPNTRWDQPVLNTPVLSAGLESSRWNDAREIPQARERDFGMPDSSEHGPIKATIVHINQENSAYPACRSDGCYKKLSDMGDGSWYCEKCDYSHSRPEYRFCLCLKVHNSKKGFFWLSCSDDVGRLILGIDANKIVRLREYDISVMQKYFADADGKTFSFKVRPKKKNYQNQQGISYDVINATPIDCVEEAEKLTGVIKSFQDNLYEKFPSFPYHAF